MCSSSENKISIWSKGEDYRAKPWKYFTYGINKGHHTNAIEIYKTEEDRDLILQLLQKHEEEMEQSLNT